MTTCRRYRLQCGRSRYQPDGHTTHLGRNTRSMTSKFTLTKRRTFLTATAAIAGAQFTGPFIIKARGEPPVKIGFIDPNTGSGVQKAHKLIERDKVDMIMGDVNSGIAYAIMGVTAEKKVFHIVPGGH